MVYQTTETCAGTGASEDRLHRYICLSAVIHGNTRQVPVYTDGSRDGNSVACATVFPSYIVISMRLPDTASIFTDEVWAIIKALEQIKDSLASKYIIFYRLTLVSPRFTIYEAGKSLDTKVSFKRLPIKTLFFVGYPAILALGVMKMQTLLPSLPWICLVSKLVYPILILNNAMVEITFKHETNN